MKRIIIIGCPGGGKSTFSRELNKKTGIPVFHLDMMNWNPDRTTVEREVFINRLNEVMSNPEWIIDGNYMSTMEMRISMCDTVFFLDYPLEVCLSGIEERRGKPRDDMPWIEPLDAPDLEFIDFVKNFSQNTRPKIFEILKRYNDKRVVIFKTRAEAAEYINTLN